MGIGTVSAGIPINSRLTVLNPQTGALIGVLYTVSDQITSIACDPLTGNIYLTNTTSSSGSVVAVDSVGTLLWTWSPATASPLYGISATNDGYVYVMASTGAKVYKIDATSGVEITTGWPYTMGTGTSPYGAGGIGVATCVDQSGNVYIGGINNAGTRAVSLTAAGGVSWSSTVTNVASPVINSQVSGLAINAAGTQLAASRYGGNTLPDGCYLLQASTGIVLGSVKNTTPGSVDIMQCAAFNATGNAYHGGSNLGAVLGGPYVRKDFSVFLSAAGVQISNALAVGLDGNVFTTTTTGYRVMCVTPAWVYDEGVTERVTALEVSTGRVGAFGI